MPRSLNRPRHRGQLRRDSHTGALLRAAAADVG